MSEIERPLSTLVAQGWEIVDYTALYDHQTSGGTDCFLMRRQKQHKILKIRKKWLGVGFAVKEIDL